MLSNTVTKLCKQRHAAAFKAALSFRAGPAPDEDVKESVTLKRMRKEITADKKALEWRTPVGDRPEDFKPTLRVFSNDEQTTDFIVMLQQPFDISIKGIKNWWQRRLDRNACFMQMYLPERHSMLGPDLAAAHFLLFRNGAVRFQNSDTWMRANKHNEFDLPTSYNPLYKVEGIKCDGLDLFYEGVENLRCLEHLKYLSFRNVKRFDDWCLDRVSGSQYISLEELDISGTAVTYRGLSCLYRIPTLKILVVDNPEESLEYKLSVAMLEEAIPKLKVIAAPLET